MGTYKKSLTWINTTYPIRRATEEEEFLSFINDLRDAVFVEELDLPKLASEAVITSNLKKFTNDFWDINVAIERFMNDLKNDSQQRT